MIKLRAILESILGEEDSPSTIQAHKLGLVSRPYGYWADPKTGQNVARSMSGQLVKLTPDHNPPESDPQADERMMAAQQSHNDFKAQQPDNRAAELQGWKEFYGTDNDDDVLRLHPELG